MSRFLHRFREHSMLLRTIKNIPVRAVKAWGYSWDGLKSAFIKEESFRLETIALVVLVAVLAVVPWPLWKKAALTATFLLIPLTELLNSAIEDICDLVSPDRHPLIKAAKDKGSSAVLLAIILNLLALAALIFI
ncbi:diacylglycerol kinase [Deltaproteobacteria bacterium OttesenSCG-928-K17]|nr:diacylglycerol kinase [Deltaproteobacteria bacterium OttesenSCG-928-K17]